MSRVWSLPASPAAEHRGRAWEPSQGSHDDALIDRARRAASLVFDDVEDVRHVETHETGVAVFAATRRAGGEVTVSLNPNGLGAGVEWRGRTKSGSGYRTLRLQGLAGPAQEGVPCR